MNESDNGVGTDTRMLAPAPSAPQPAEAQEPQPLPSRQSATSGGTSAFAIILIVLLLAGCGALWYWVQLLQAELGRAQVWRAEIGRTTVGAASLEYRTAYYALQSFLESGETESLAEARAALGPAVRLASRVLASTEQMHVTEDLQQTSYARILSAASAQLTNAIDHIIARTRYYGRVQDLDRHVIQRISPRLLLIADATALRASPARDQASAPPPGLNDKAVASTVQELESIARSYLEMGVLPDAKPAPKVTQASAADTARKAMKLANDFVFKSSEERYSKWEGVHYWEIVFTKDAKDLKTFVDAQTGRFLGYIRPEHTILQRGERPSLSRGEALARARTILPSIPDISRDLVVGPVEFDGTWKVTFWPKVNGAIYYSHPIVVWVDARSNEPYGYQSLRLPPRDWPQPLIGSAYAATQAKKFAERGFMKDAFTEYRGSTFLAVERSRITAEDTLVWASDFVISARYHENTGYDMALVLVNAKDGRYEGYRLLGDGPLRIDWWSRRPPAISD